MTTHRWRDTIGAVIDVEASGTGGIGGFPLLVYNMQKSGFFFLSCREFSIVHDILPNTNMCTELINLHTAILLSNRSQRCNEI